MQSTGTFVFPARGDREAIENGQSFQPKFGADGLIPCICQEAATGQVLMFAFMNREALELTLKTGEAHYYSRSRGKLWHKGESSGNTQRVIEMLVDCDQDVILIRVDTRGAAACHTGFHSCFFRKVASLPTRQLPPLENIGGERQFDPEQVYGKK